MEDIYLYISVEVFGDQLFMDLIIRAQPIYQFADIINQYWSIADI